jgi:serine/threonine-protein kinase
MGDVYLAEHQLLKRKCAVKLIRRDKAADRRMLARFEREVKATAQLTHWNTIQVYDYGSTPDGIFYYSMEYLQGLNLRQVVDQYGPLPPGRVIFILRQLCGALHEASGVGLVHRDIKPSNIFLAERGQLFDVAKLLDFGLVRPATLGTCPIRNVSRELQGSPRFMCPEQAQGQKPDFRGDLYSLACVAYFLLSGRGPFEDDNPVMLVVAHANFPAPRLSEIGVEIPSDLEDIVMKCLNKKPEERFQSARELQQALETCKSANEWSWDDAEKWWHEKSRKQRTENDMPTPSPLDDHVVKPGSILDPDPTYVCEDRSAFEKMF